MYFYLLTTSLLFPTPDNDIKDFMAFYRQDFSHASILPKMHFLECHVPWWIKKWKCGLGFHGEQGAESIHNVFNHLSRQYACVRNGTDKLKCICLEHHRQIHPETLSRVPKIKKRK